MNMDSLEQQNVTVWLRRPTLFMASAWYLLCAAGLWALPWLLDQLTALLRSFAGWQVPLAGMEPVLFYLGLMALPVVLYCNDKPGIGLSLRLRRPAFAGALPLSLLCGLTAAGACDRLGECWRRLICLVGGGAPAAAVPPPSGWQEIVLSLFFLAVLPALCEELFFRGAILGAWERRGTVKGVWVSAMLFCLLHGSVAALPVHLLMGALLGFAVVRTGSLLAPVLIHLFYNAAGLTLSWLGLTAEALPLWLLLAETVSLCALSGAAFWLLLREGEPLEQVGAGDKKPLDAPELTVFLTGMITVLLRFGQDLLVICGIL